MEMVFGSKDSTGRRLVVYMSRPPGKKGLVKYSSRGIIPDKYDEGFSPMNEDTKEYVLGGGSLPSKANLLKEGLEYD